MFLLAVFGSVLLSCCVGSIVLRRFDVTTEATDTAAIQDIAKSVPSIQLPAAFKPSKAAVKESAFGNKAQVVEWKTPGGSRFIMGTVDQDYDPQADPGKMMQELPIKNPIGISYELLKEILPSTSVEINGTVIQLRVVDINPTTQAGSVVGIFPTKEGKTGVVFIKTNAEDIENMQDVGKLLETIR
jgi:hypothetical protein